MKHPKQNSGFSLLEVTFAMGILAITIAVVAQGLATFYGQLNMEDERIVAVNACRSILSQMRSVRDQGVAEGVCECGDPEEEDPGDYSQCMFHCKMLEAFPDGSELDGPETLKNSQFTITYDDVEGNPLVVTVTLEWTGIRGRAMTAAVTSALADV